MYQNRRVDQIWLPGKDDVMGSQSQKTMEGEADNGSSDCRLTLNDAAASLRELIAVVKVYSECSSDRNLQTRSITVNGEKLNSK